MVDLLFDIEWFTGATGQRLVLTLFHFIWQALLIGGLSLSAMAFFKMPTSCYNVGVLGLIMMAVLPCATFLWLSPDNSGYAVRSILGSTAGDSHEQNVSAPIDLASVRNQSGSEADAVRKRAHSNAAMSILGLMSPFVLTGYGIGVLLMLSRLLSGFVGGFRLKRSAAAIEHSALLKFLEALAQR